MLNNIFDYNHYVMCSPTLKCTVKSYVTRPSTKCYFNGSLFMRVLMHDKIDQIHSCDRWNPNWWFLKTIQVSMKHVLFCKVCIWNMKHVRALSYRRCKLYDAMRSWELREIRWGGRQTFMWRWPQRDTPISLYSRVAIFTLNEPQVKFRRCAGASLTQAMVGLLHWKV